MAHDPFCGCTECTALIRELADMGAPDPVAARIDETNRLLTEANEQLRALGKSIGAEIDAWARNANRRRKPPTDDDEPTT